MMRKIEQEMIEAIKTGRAYQKQNTTVSHSEESIKVYLHGNLIAKITDNELWLSDAEWQSKTTKSRLNCILSHFNLPTISVKKFQWYVGKEIWLGSYTFDIPQKR